jgi:hypothetical protein
MLTNIEQAYALITDYTNKTGRPGIPDLMTFDILVDMHESDESDPYYWTTTPDVVMQHIVDNNEQFTIDYGWEDMSDAIRDYLTDNDFVKDVDDVEDEEEEENDN